MKRALVFAFWFNGSLGVASGAMYGATLNSAYLGVAVTCLVAVVVMRYLVAKGEA